MAVDLALLAGANVSSSTDIEIIATKSSKADLCTQVDVENERLVTAGLQRAFGTDIKIIGEETYDSSSVVLTDEPTFIIDPIDGTTNFTSGLPCCVSIGLAVKQKPVMGVVYAPQTDEVYVAVQGHGAFCNGKPLRKHDVAPVSLQDAIVCFELGYVRDETRLSKMLAVLSRLLPLARATRQLGSGVLDLCYVAQGRLDAVYAGVAGEGWKPWDYCAGYVIAQETGCVVEAIEGDFHLFSESIICATHKELASELRGIILDTSKK